MLGGVQRARHVRPRHAGAVQLAGGQLAAQGIASNAPVKHLAIVGGNGRYLDARGDLELVENGDGTGSALRSCTTAYSA